jgi:hypothetical protein
MRARPWKVSSLVVLAATGAALALPAASSAAPPGTFVSVCEFSHESRNDPIALPRMHGKSHLHHFFGNRSTNARSTARKLRRRPATTCTAGDRSAYWVPALMIDEKVIQPRVMRAYYVSNEKDPRTIQAPPKGLKAIAGNGSALMPQSPRISAWTCSTGLPGPIFYTEYPFCQGGMYLILSVHFPDCWDGVNLDSPDHQSHLAYSTPGHFGLGYSTCPATHPVPIPSLQTRVLYPTSGARSGIELSSGGVNSGHADFINGWPQKALEDLVANCIRKAVDCAN